MVRPNRLFLLAAMLSGSVATASVSANGGDYWQALQWQQRPLVLVDGGDGRAAAWRERLRADRCALDERRIHWLVVRPDGSVWRRIDGGRSAGFERSRLDPVTAADVQRRVDWQPGADSRLWLFGLDGREKYAGRPETLDVIWSRIDAMPMRRAEMAREPDDCAP